ncbi:delta-60 repeat domain-containing protein, partial [Thermodesulfobacteriota bacterium]
KSNQKRIDTMKINLILIFLVGLAVLFSAAPAFGLIGTLDPAFDGDGKVITDVNSNTEAGNDVAVQSDGRIVVVGSTSGDFLTIRYNSDGSPDPSFGVSGVTGTVVTDLGVGYNDYARAVAIQPDGKIVVAGYVDNTPGLYDFAVARYNSDGTLDISFSQDAGYNRNDYATDVAIDASGRIVVAGYIDNAGWFQVVLMRFDSTGSPDTTFGTSGIVVTPPIDATDYAQALTIQPDGQIVVAGYTSLNGTPDFLVLRYNSSDGSLDSSFNGTGYSIVEFPDVGSVYDEAFGVTLQPDGKIVVAGTSFASPTAMSILRLNPDGSLFPVTAGRLSGYPTRRIWQPREGMSSCSRTVRSLSAAGLTTAVTTKAMIPL